MTQPSAGALILVALLVTLPAACAQSDAPGAPGGQAATKITGAEGRGGAVTPSPVEVWQDGKLVRTLRWEELSALPTQSFSTGLEDEQTGHLLVDVLRLAGITEGKAVILHGRGLNEPVQLGWNVIANPHNKVLVGLTHKNTMKVVAGNFEFMNRERWVRHLYKIEIEPGAPGDNRAEKRAGRADK